MLLAAPAALCVAPPPTHPQVGRTSEMSRVYGIDFFSTLTRGSQVGVKGLEV